MSQQRVLVIEDDKAVRRGIVDALRYYRYDTVEAGDGEAGLDLALKAEIDLILLDLILPKRDGLEILRQVRSDRASLPVIILTARGEEADRIEGLRMGADDYVVKPFSVKELMARVEAVLRRSPERPKEVFKLPLPGGEADLETSEVRFEDGTLNRLTESETKLLRYLARSAGKTVTREEILTRVWGMSRGGVETRTVDMHIARLREKLRDETARPRLIETVRGKGYRLTPPEETE